MAKERYLLVDAYNVIHAVPSLRRHLSEGLDAARDILAESVRSIHDAEGVRTALVLDSRSERIEVEHPYGVKSFEYLYAPAALSADGAIERIAARAGAGTEISVASEDRMVRESVRASGAHAISATELMDWAEACERRLAQDAARRRKENEKAWRNGIDL